MARKCWKCGSKKKITRHHIYGKNGLCGLPYTSNIPLKVLLCWMGKHWDDVDIIFWDMEIIDLCRKCHDSFHIFITKLLLKCDSMQSEEPLRNLLEEYNERRVGSR